MSTRTMRASSATGTKATLVRAPVQSKYEKYPLPFFDRNNLSTWSVTPTGDYPKDFETGQGYAREFIRTCDRTNGWLTLLPSIVSDIVGSWSGDRWPIGRVRMDGIVIGFMHGLADELCLFSEILGKREEPEVTGAP
jgi:hypothetical protein